MERFRVLQVCKTVRGGLPSFCLHAFRVALLGYLRRSSSVTEIEHREDNACPQARTSPTIVVELTNNYLRGKQHDETHDDSTTE
jgi:hypothetical protein